MKTPLLVTHAAACASTAPTLTLQMDTQAAGSLEATGLISGLNGLTISGDSTLSTLTVEDAMTTNGSFTIKLRLMSNSGSNTEANTDAPASDVIRLDHQLALLMKVTSGRTVTIKSAAHGYYWYCGGGTLPGTVNDQSPFSGDNKWATWFKISPTYGGMLIMCNGDYWNYALAASGSGLGWTDTTTTTADYTEKFAIFEPKTLDDGSTPWPYPGAVTIHNAYYETYVYQANNGGVGEHNGLPNDANYAFYIDFLDELS